MESRGGLPVNHPHRIAARDGKLLAWKERLADECGETRLNCKCRISSVGFVPNAKGNIASNTCRNWDDILSTVAQPKKAPISYLPLLSPIRYVDEHLIMGWSEVSAFSVNSVQISEVG